MHTSYNSASFFSLLLQLYVPVTEYFDLNALREYHADIVTFEDFMYELAPTHWPLDERVAYCSSKAAEGNNDVCPRVNQEHGGGDYDDVDGSGGVVEVMVVEVMLVEVMVVEVVVGVVDMGYFAGKIPCQ